MNQYPTALTKITRPTLPDVFPRKRVFDLLEDSRKRPIIWVSGPPGCGKTTLVGSFIETLKIPCLWYNLDERDSDPATFFYYMGLAAKKAASRIRKPLPLLTPEYLPGISTFTRRYFENLCQRLKSPSVIVFDNYQEVPGEAVFHEVICTGVSAISPGINVIFISRSKPHALFVRQKANRMMQAVGWDHLRFSLEETQELLKFNFQKRPSEKTIEDLYRITDGWVAGLVLMLETARRQPLESRQINDMTQEDIFIYFANEIFEGNPWLHYWMGVCCFPLNPCRSQSYLERAYEQFKKRRDPNGTFLAWSGMIDVIIFSYDEVKLLDQWIQELESRMDEYAQLSSKEIKHRVTNSMFIALLLRQPHHPEMENWAEKTLLVSKNELDENIKALSLFNLAHHRMMTGELDKLASILYDLNRLAGAPSASPLTQIRAKFPATVYYQAIGAHEQCMSVMKEALKLSKKTGVHMMDFWLLAYGTGSALNNSDFKTAEHLFDKMSACSDRLKPWELSVYHFLKAREAMIRDDLKQANVHAKLSLELAEKVGTSQKRCWPLLLKAQVMHGLHKYTEANEYLEQVFAIGQQTKSRLFKFYVNITKAQFAFDHGNPGDGLKLLRQALTLGQAQQYMNTFVDQPAVTAKLCVIALEAGIEVEYVQEIIRRRQLVPDEPPVHLENWPWALKIYTLGRFGLVRDGKPVRFSRKAREKPLALLKALIAFGGREVHEEHIADALWPEADGYLAHKSFATTLWRLRKLIGCPDAIQLSDRKLTLDPRYCWVDVWAFERIIRLAETTWKQGMKENDMTYAISMVQNALDIYQGPFLAAEANAYWAISLRERLQNRFLRTVKRLCEYWKQTGQHENAVECFQRSIEVDDLIDDFYHDLMTCYWQLGRRTDALSTYERYKETVSSKLGVQPSPEANRLRKAIVSELNSNI